MIFLQIPSQKLQSQVSQSSSLFKYDQFFCSSCRFRLTDIIQHADASKVLLKLARRGKSCSNSNPKYSTLNFVKLRQRTVFG